MFTVPGQWDDRDRHAGDCTASGCTGSCTVTVLRRRREFKLPLSNLNQLSNLQVASAFQVVCDTASDRARRAAGAAAARACSLCHWQSR